MEFLYTIIGTPLGYIMWAFYLLVHNFGIAIILFTIATRLAMFPLNLKQQKNTAKSQLFMPRVQEIQTRYRNDKVKQQEELAKLQKEGYNPMAGCAPILVMFVVLFGLLDVVYRPMTHIAHFEWTQKGSTSMVIEVAKTTEIANVILQNPKDAEYIERYKADSGFFTYPDTAKLEDTPADQRIETPEIDNAKRTTYGVFSAAQWADLTGKNSKLSPAVISQLNHIPTKYSTLQRELYAINEYGKYPQVFAQAIPNPEIIQKCDEL
jgi:YidC/Oxa1 family membrane protein insertase